jgi:hypothetical protein
MEFRKLLADICDMSDDQVFEAYLEDIFIYVFLEVYADQMV